MTDKILPIPKEWQQRPLEAVYTVIFLDAIYFHVRSEGQAVKKAIYIAIGIDLDGQKDFLGMWDGESENAKFWATALNGLRNRSVEDIFIACTDKKGKVPETAKVYCSYPANIVISKVAEKRTPVSIFGQIFLDNFFPLDCVFCLSVWIDACKIAG